LKDAEAEQLAGLLDRVLLNLESDTEPSE